MNITVYLGATMGNDPGLEQAARALPPGVRPGALRLRAVGRAVARQRGALQKPGP